MVFPQHLQQHAVAVALIAVLGMGCTKPRRGVLVDNFAPTTSRTLEIPICPQSLAILDVRVQCTAPDTVTQNFVLPIAERIEIAFLATGRFEVVERNRIGAVQIELVQAQDDLWFDQATVAKLGQFLGARYIALPTARINVGVFTTNIDLLVKVVDAERATTVETFEVKTSSASASVNSSLNNSLEKLPAALAKALRPVYPARAQAGLSPN